MQRQEELPEGDQLQRRRHQLRQAELALETFRQRQPDRTPSDRSVVARKPNCPAVAPQPAGRGFEPDI